MTTIEASMYRRVLALHEWTFVYGLPVTRRQFRSPNSDFCAYPGYTFDVYQRTLLATLEEVVLPFRSRGLSVMLAATSGAYAASLTEQRAVVLFTHCASQRRKIEFRDGLVGYDKIVARVSRWFRGLADVSACNPVGFGETLQRRAPDCATRIPATRLTAVSWLRFYGLLFSQFAMEDMSCAEAYMRTELRLRAIGI